MRLSLYLLIASVLMIRTVSAQSGETHHAQMDLDCSSCHVCKRPTYEKPCLKIFPEFTRRKGVTVHHSAEDAPEILKIDILSNLYEPTIFTHKLHAEMAGMSGGCESCHHFNPPGRIAGCYECHDPDATGTDLDRPGLKGAYHRQCLNCHREWSHSNECTVCHALKGDPDAATLTSVKASLQETRHPTVTEPKQLVYETEYDELPIVTFYHDDHAQRYDLKCVDCHQNESCSRCHDTMREAKTADKEPHDNCINCHEIEIDDNCQYCHDTKVKERFDHAQTGFSLIKYHSNLECQDCHRNEAPSALSKTNGDCNFCHRNWNVSNFNHEATGLVLDENHRENDCEDCHPNRNFTAAPGCDLCHDELSYPKDKPGKLIR